MAGIRELLEAVRDNDLAAGRLRGVLHIAIGHTLQPGCAGDGGEALSEEVGDGSPLGQFVFGQAHDAGTDAIFGR